MKTNIDNIRNKFEVGLHKQLLAAKGTLLQDFVYEGSKLTYTIEGTYNPDFTLYMKDGRTIYIEGKGYLRPEDKKKLAHVKAQHPEIDLRIVFQRDARFPRTKTTYTMWAAKQGIPSAVGEIPREWLK